MSEIDKIEELSNELESIKVAIRDLTVPTTFLIRLNAGLNFTFAGLIYELDIGQTRHSRKNAYKRIQNSFKHLMDDPVWVTSYHYNVFYGSYPTNPTSILFTPKGYVKAISIFDNTTSQAYANVSAELFYLYSQTVTIREKLLPLYEHQLNLKLSSAVPTSVSSRSVRSPSLI